MIRFVTGRAGPYARYRLAGRVLHSDFPLTDVAAEAAVAALVPKRPKKPPSDPLPTFAGMAHIAGGPHKMTCLSTGDTVTIQIEDIGELYLDDVENIIHFTPSSAFDAAIATQLLIGPALPLLLAKQDCYALHAAALETPAGLIALAGSSGSGKSTLAALGNTRWRRIYDDVAPIDGYRLTAAGCYPQLKLTPTLINPADDLPLRAVVCLAPSNERQRTNLVGLRPAEAILNLSRHTVAVKLFDEARLRAHLSFCRRTAERVPVCRLSYRQTPDQLASMMTALETLQ